jgi:arylformamidase
LFELRFRLRGALKLFDISRSLFPGMPVYPGDPAFEKEELSKYPVFSRLELGTHTGTHVDAPAHLGIGPGVDRISLEVLCGPARVVEPSDFFFSERLLFKGADFHLDRATAKNLVEKNVRLVGVEGLSIDEDLGAHEELLRAGVAILEGLDLSGAPVGDYTLFCLPLKISGGDGAPARAILWKDENESLS